MENSKTINRAIYLAWLRQNFPLLYDMAISEVKRASTDSALSGFFDSVSSAFSSVVKSVGNSLPGLAKTYADYDAQKRLIKANTERASQGLPMLEYDGQGRLITAQGVPYSAQDLQLAAQTGIGVDKNTVLLLGAAAILLLILLYTRR